MELRLAHGREHPDDVLDGWGFDGPSLSGVESMQQMYGETCTVRFLDAQAAAVARRATGWPQWDETTLEMLRHGDLIVTREPGKPRCYYADLFLFQHGAISNVEIAQRHVQVASRTFDDALHALRKSAAGQGGTHGPQTRA